MKFAASRPFANIDLAARIGRDRERRRAYSTSVKLPILPGDLRFRHAGDGNHHSCLLGVGNRAGALERVRAAADKANACGEHA
jgi:hypothetical protein